METLLWRGGKATMVEVPIPDPNSPDFQDSLLNYFVHQAFDKSDVLYEQMPLEERTFHQPQIEELHASVLAQKQKVENQKKEHGPQVILRYLQAEQHQNIDQRVSNRIKQFPSFQIASDVDKTITCGDHYLNRLPGSTHAENYIHAHGREDIALIHARYWGEPLRHPQVREIYHRVGKTIPIREGVGSFIEQVRGNNAPFSIVTANFRPFIEGILTNLPEVDEIFCTEHNNMASCDKGTVIIDLATRYPNRALIFIGDGQSDLPAISDEAQQYVACYFALEGGSFARELAKRDLPHFTYKDFNDIHLKLASLGILETSAKKE